MQRVATAEARKRFAEIIQTARRRGQRTKITQYGKTAAILIPKEDMKRLEECERAQQARTRRAGAR
jgi:prevent-host-death family protein